MGRGDRPAAHPGWCARAVNLRHVDDAGPPRRGAILEGYRDQVLEVLHINPTAQSPVVVVGQSMGAQVAELVAAARPNIAVGLALITPVPLAGYRLTPSRQPASVTQRTIAPWPRQRRIGVHYWSTIQRGLCGR